MAEKSKTTPTVAEIDGWIAERRQRIAAKSAALEAARQEVGALALAGDVAQGPDLARLQSELEVEKLALAAAEAKKPAAELQARLDRLTRLEQNHATNQERLDEIGPRVEALQDELSSLLPEMTQLAQGQFGLERAILELKAKVRLQ